MSDLPPIIPAAPAGPVHVAVRPARKPRGYFPPHIVRGVCFYLISLCLIASVIVCILAIWDFAKKDSLWRLIASFLVVGAGTATFALVNGIFGEENNG
jgi:hypothetical protein